MDREEAGGAAGSNGQQSAGIATHAGSRWGRLGELPRLSALRRWSQLRPGPKPPATTVPGLPLTGDGRGPLVRPRATERVPLPRSRPRLLQPLPLIGLLLVVVALVGYLAVYSQATSRRPVLVAVRDLPAGAVVRAGDVRSAGLAGERAVVGSLVPARELPLVLGRRVAIAVAAGAPLPRSVLAARARIPAAFTLVLPVLHALGGQLRPGDRVSVLATFQSGNGARTRAIARGLEVLTVGQPPPGFAPASATIQVTLALPDPSLAAALALANQAGKIDLLRDATGGGAAPIPAARVGG